MERLGGLESGVSTGGGRRGGEAIDLVVDVQSHGCVAVRVGADGGIGRGADGGIGAEGEGGQPSHQLVTVLVFDRAEGEGTHVNCWI